MRYTILIIFSLFTTVVSGQWRPSPYYYQYKGLKIDGPLLLPVSLSVDGNLDRAGGLRYNTTTNKVQFWDGSLWNDLVSGSTDQYIFNRQSPAQDGNYYISGNGSATKITAVNPDNAAYQRYFVFGRDGVDTTKQLWSLGIYGVPGAPGGGPSGNSGGTLKFRAYTTSGATIGDILSVSRQGRVDVSGALYVGTGTPSYAGALTVAGNVGVTGGVSMTGGLSVGQLIVENGTSTITGDYTVTSDDVYVNVNNATNCTITIPVANPTTLFRGRRLHIKKISNNAATVTIVVQFGIQTIDGNSSYVISGAGDPVMLHDDGSNWFTYSKSATATPSLDAVTDVGNSTPNTITVGGLRNTGAFFPKLSVVTTGTTLTDAYSTVIANTNDENCTITLPSGGFVNGIMYFIKRSSPSNTLTINTNELDNFDDFSTTMEVANSIIVQLQGNTWYVLAKY
jgi:hypothetical protein